MPPFLERAVFRGALLSGRRVRPQGPLGKAPQHAECQRHLPASDLAGWRGSLEWGQWKEVGRKAKGWVLRSQALPHAPGPNAFMECTPRAVIWGAGFRSRPRGHVRSWTPVDRRA